MRHLVYRLGLLAAALCLPLQLAADESAEMELPEHSVDFPGTQALNDFMAKMEHADEQFAHRCPEDYPDHRLRVAFAMEGMRTLRGQLQELYLRTRHDEFAAGLPIVDEMEVFLEELAVLAISTLKPLSGPRLMPHVHRLRCWLSYMRGSLECEDRYFVKYALENLSEHTRALRKAYAYRQCWEMTYWKRFYCYEPPAHDENLGEEG
jgi:hypothetical protein